MFKEIRIYAEVYEQGLCFLEEIKKIQQGTPELPKDLRNLEIKIIQLSKKTLKNNSLLSFVRNRKKFDLVISIIKCVKE